MQQTKRPLLVLGLLINTFISVIYIISFLSSTSHELFSVIVFIFSIIIFIVNVKSFYTVNLNAKEFKKKMYLPWISFGLSLIYSLFLLIIILTSDDNGYDVYETLLTAMVIVIWLSLLAYIPGILTKIIDNKITYDEHINKK